jgi:hypothetical protein
MELPLPWLLVILKLEVGLVVLYKSVLAEDYMMIEETVDVEEK